MRTVVYFATCSPEEIRRIRREYGIPPGMSVNGETECRLTEETLKGLQAEAERGLVQIRRKPDMPPPLPPPEKRRMPRRTMPQGQREEEKPRRAAQKRRRPENGAQLKMFDQNQERDENLYRISERQDGDKPEHGV